jgi:hypothetical protein
MTPQKTASSLRELALAIRQRRVAPVDGVSAMAELLASHIESANTVMGPIEPPRPPPQTEQPKISWPTYFAEFKKRQQEQAATGGVFPSDKETT